MPRLDVTRVEEVNGRPLRSESEQVREVLDHLLEPLDFPSTWESDSQLQPWAWEVASGGDGTGDGLAAATIMFCRRLRWSPRLRYRLPRLVVTWIFLVLTFFFLAWLALKGRG